MSCLVILRILLLLVFAVFLAAAGESAWLYAIGFPYGGVLSVLRVFAAGITSYALIGLMVLVHVIAGAAVTSFFLRLRRKSPEPLPGPAAWIISSLSVSSLVWVLTDQLNDRFLRELVPTHPLSILLIVVSGSAWVGMIGPLAGLSGRIGRKFLAGRGSTGFAARRRFIICAVFAVLAALAALSIRPVDKITIPWNDFSLPAEYSKGEDTGILVSGDYVRPARIVLVSVETFRADHLNSLGYERRITTPELDRIARAGYLFSRCRAQAPWTKPSVASIITSMYPCRHGQVAYGTEVADSLITLPEALAAVGYKTAAFPTINGAHDRNFGFHENFYQGFGPPRRPWPSLFQVDLFHGGRLVAGILERRLRIYARRKLSWWYNDAEKVTSAVVRWLDSPDPNLFCHVHFIDPHTPYLTHPYKPVELNFRSKNNLPSLLKKYDGEISYVDRSLGEIAELLEKRNEPAILVITGDHGEEFLDRGGWGHGHSLYDELIRVPLVFGCFHMDRDGLAARGAVFAEPVSTIDIAPTILELAGVATPPAGWDGVSLLPLLDSSLPARGNSPVVSHMKSGDREAHSIIRDNIKVILFSGNRIGGERDMEAYDLSADAAERYDICEKRLTPRGELTEKMSAAATELDSLVDAFESPAESAVHGHMSQSEAEILKTLGYLR